MGRQLWSLPGLVDFWWAHESFRIRPDKWATECVVVDGADELVSNLVGPLMRRLGNGQITVSETFELRYL